MLHVLHVIGAMDRAGAETALMNWYRHIDRNEIQFDFLVHEERPCDYDEEIEHMGGRIFRVPRFTGINLLTYRKAVRDIFAAHPECKIVHGHIGSCAAVYLHEANKLGRITIAHSHSQKLSDPFARIAFDTVSFPTRHIAQDFLACSPEAGLARFGRSVVEGNNFHVLTNGIELERYICTEEEHEQAKQSQGWQGRIVVGHVGRFEHEKNHPFLLETFAAFKAEHPEALLVLVGRGSGETTLKEQAVHLGITESVVFYGMTDDVPSVLKAFDLFVFPSFKEGLSIAALEAQATGVPCLLSDGLPPLVAVGRQTRRLPLSLGAESWAKAASELVLDVSKEAPTSARQISPREQGATDVAASGFDAQASADWLVQHYHELLQRNI